MSNFGCDYSRANLDRTTVLEIADTCAKPIGDPDLDGLFETYNEGSPRQDDPQYYRFLYQLGKKYWNTRIIELGLHYGAASYHFLRGNIAAYRDFIGPSLISSLEPRWGGIGIDCDSRIKPHLKEMFDINGYVFINDHSTNECVSKSIKDGYCEVLLIDTDHAYETTKNEFKLWEPKLKPGGLILFDDIDAPEYADGCGKFFKELDGEKISLPHLHPENWGFGVWFKE